MFKRIFWMGTGVAVGAGGAFWAKRKVEETVELYLPEQVAERAAAGAKGLAGTVKAAAAEGRDAMRATESELRSRVEQRTFIGGETEAVAADESTSTSKRRSARPAAVAGTGVAGRRRARR